MMRLSIWAKAFYTVSTTFRIPKSLKRAMKFFDFKKTSSVSSQRTRRQRPAPSTSIWRTMTISRIKSSES